MKESLIQSKIIKKYEKEGYYVIKLEAKRGGKQRPLSELYEDIKRTLTVIEQQKKLNEQHQQQSMDKYQ
jgi:parvulin-like peptidyl-prolyl isomerase